MKTFNYLLVITSFLLSLLVGFFMFVSELSTVAATIGWSLTPVVIFVTLFLLFKYLHENILLILAGMFKALLEGFTSILIANNRNVINSIKGFDKELLNINANLEALREKPIANCEDSTKAKKPKAPIKFTISLEEYAVIRNAIEESCVTLEQLKTLALMSDAELRHYELALRTNKNVNQELVNELVDDAAREVFEPKKESEHDLKAYVSPSVKEELPKTSTE